jgi:hypothetical protein
MPVRDTPGRRAVAFSLERRHPVCRKPILLGSGGSAVRGRCCRDIATLGEQPGQIQGAAGVPAGSRASVRRLGSLDVSLQLQDNAEVGGSGGVAALVGAAIREHGGRIFAALREQASEIKRTVNVAARVGPPVGRLCTLQVALRFKQDAQARGCRRVAFLVGAAIDRFRVREVA